MKIFITGFVLGVSSLITSGMTVLCGELLKERDELRKQAYGPYQPYISNGCFNKNRKA